MFIYALNCLFTADIISFSTPAPDALSKLTFNSLYNASNIDFILRLTFSSLPFPKSFTFFCKLFFNFDTIPLDTVIAFKNLLSGLPPVTNRNVKGFCLILAIFSNDAISLYI